MSSPSPLESGSRPISRGYTSANEEGDEDPRKVVTLDPSISAARNSSRYGSPTLSSPGRSPPANARPRFHQPAETHADIHDPFDNTKVHAYSFKPNIVPPYVLDGLSQVHYRDQLDNSNINTTENQTASGRRKSLKSSQLIPSQTQQQIDDETQYLSFSNDPFIKSLGENKWQNFLATIQQPTAYTSDLVNFDEHFDKKDNQLNSSWGGEDRLKLALLGTPSSDEDTYVGDESGSMLSKLFGFKGGHKKKSGSRDNDAPKVRSKAGYWMSDEKRADVLPMLNRFFVHNPLVPLFLRILIIIFSVLALALACSIFVFSRRRYDDTKIEQQPSTIMAIVVQCCAIAYVIYIAYDEYSGKPLGLRNPLGKMKLIMLDLLFIIFSAANLSLTFNTLYDDEWVCQADSTPAPQRTGFLYPTVHSICRRQRALASFLFLVLCLWLLTFTISIIRVVDRVSVASPRNGA